MTGEVAPRGTSAPISWSVRTLVFTLQATRQAIYDTRRVPAAGSNGRDTRGWAWSERALVSAVGLDHHGRTTTAVRAGGFLHVSPRIFADAVRTGMSTNACLGRYAKQKFSEDELRPLTGRRFSPVPYMHRLGRYRSAAC